MSKERAPKNDAQRVITGQLRRSSYIKPEQGRSTPRQNRANSYAVRPAAPAEKSKAPSTSKAPVTV